jgi:hypothetical protein
MLEKSESRFDADLLIRVFGMDANGRPFHKNANARNISDRGATLFGLEKQLRPGDVIGVQVGDRKAPCQVVWTADAGLLPTIEVGVRMMPGQLCPWQTQRDVQQAAATRPIARVKPAAANKRKFLRRRILFPIELLDGRSVTHMETSDITGNGCYVETMQPLPASKDLKRELLAQFQMYSHNRDCQDQRSRSRDGH